MYSVYKNSALIKCFNCYLKTKKFSIRIFVMKAIKVGWIPYIFRVSPFSCSMYVSKLSLFLEQVYGLLSYFKNTKWLIKGVQSPNYSTVCKYSHIISTVRKLLLWKWFTLSYSTQHEVPGHFCCCDNLFLKRIISQVFFYTNTSWTIFACSSLQWALVTVEILSRHIKYSLSCQISSSLQVQVSKRLRDLESKDLNG